MTIEEHLRKLAVRWKFLWAALLVLIVAVKVAASSWFPAWSGIAVPYWVPWVLLALLLACIVLMVAMGRKLRCPKCGIRIGITATAAVPHACPNCQLDFRQPYMGAIGASPIS